MTAPKDGTSGPPDFDGPVRLVPVGRLGAGIRLRKVVSQGVGTLRVGMAESVARALVVVPHGPVARHVLRDVVVDAKGGDLLAPVTVAVPSSYCGLSVRRWLGSGLGIVNVRFLALARVAELLGAPYLAEPDRRPLTSALLLGAIHGALAEDPGELAPVARHPMTVQSLAATLSDLRVLDDGELDRLARGGGRAPTVVRLYRRVHELTREHYDDEDQLAAAAAVVDAGGPAVDDIGTLVLYLPRSLSPAGRAFVEAFARRGRARAILGLTGDATADDDTATLASRLATALGDPQRVGGGAHLPRGDVVVSCPDADEEVRTAVRQILGRLERGTPLHRVAVGYRATEPYARLLHEHFDAAGIPVYGPSPRRLTDSAAGRALLGLLALPDSDYRRDEVMAVVTGAPILEAPGQRAPGPRWDRLSCAANVVAGLDEWSRRLSRHADHRRDLLARRAAQAGTLFAADVTDRVVDDCDRLTAFVTEFGTRLAPPVDGAWGALSAWASGLLDRYVGRTLPRAAPEAEQLALERVRAIVEGLAGLDVIGAPPSVASFRRVLEEELDVSVGHTGSFGDGVLVAPVHSLLGTDYDALYLVGMSEGTFPPPPRDDTVLPDLERERVSGALPRRPERRARERTTYLAALAAAPTRVLSYPRADTRSQREARPAAGALETASAHARRLVAAHELDPGAATIAPFTDAGWFRMVSSFDHAVRDAAAPASEQEHDLQSMLKWHGTLLRHPLVRSEPRLAAGIRAVRARTGRRIDAWDGVVDPRLVTRPGEEVAMSATALETWAQCPFRYFLDRLLSVRAIERPEFRDRISPRERGTLVHGVLEQFLREHPRHAPGEPWSPDERGEMRALAGDACDAAERDGITGRPVLWRVDRTRIVRELERVLDTDESVRANRGLVPHGVEVGFGSAGDSLPPVRFELTHGAPVTFRGRIDRVDGTPDGHFEVFDYKTGKAGDLTDEDLAADPVQEGTRLQLAIYAMAVRGGDGDEPVRASYWFTRETGEQALRGFTLDATSEKRVRDVLDLMADHITAGHFPAYPGEDDYWYGPTNCRYCDYQRLCPQDRVRRFERRRGDPALEGILALREPAENEDELDDEDDE
jgi:ATP-dependent helicase/nuclease subunit B